MAKMNVYEVVTNQIISHLEKGVIPWKQPWKPGQEAINWFTGKPYRGINKLLTHPGGEYATFLQITNAGGKVKKGEKSTPVVFFTTGEKENEDGEKETYRYYTVYKVFEINTQCTGLQSKRVLDESVAELNPIEEAEKLIEGYADRPEIRYVSGKASYSPSMDLVSVPQWVITKFWKNITALCIMNSSILPGA